ncbi:protein PSY1 [Solanum verrucosum]|uniref:protein PSY1 n=1 Tax=Solanum verrucosum TaxID=315347 RepID=UPI0020CFF040|nr:protein PSY1 [Solanum verrucosum]XP_049411870.1 protein PSY1 [Solanum stenotomum]
MAAGFGIRHYLCMMFLLSIIFCVSARNFISISDDEMTMLQVQMKRSLLSVQLDDYGSPSANRNHYPGKPSKSKGGRG